MSDLNQPFGTVIGGADGPPVPVNPQNTNDGNAGTASVGGSGVVGAGTFHQWWASDLGAPYWVSAMYTYSTAGYVHEIYYSVVGTSGPWLPVGYTGTPSGNATLTLAEPILARYWRVGKAQSGGGLFFFSGVTLNTWQILEATVETLPGVSPSDGQLIIEYFTNNGTTFGPSTLDGVIHDAVKVGWSWYSRYPANAFFTLRQDSIHNSRLVPLLTHIRINYVNPGTGHRVVVFTGRLTEPDQSGEDVVYSAWNYLAELSLSRTGYRTMYPNKRIGTEIAAVEWAAAKAQTYSLMGHVVTGTIEDPLGLDAVTPIKTDQRFGVIDVPRLLLMFDLTEIGRANTQNNVTFGISRTAPFTFSFLKNAGTHRAGRKLTYPGNVRDFRFVPGYASLRNDLATIGTSTDGGPVEIVKTDETNAATYGRRQDVFTIKTLAGVSGAATELDAQNAVTARAVKEATALSNMLVLDVRPGLVEPFDGWDIEDTVVVDVNRGRTVLNATYRIVGVRGLMDAGGYHPQLIVQLPTAA